MSGKKKEIRIYSLPSKKEPFTEWLNELDKTTRNRVWRRLDRLEMSNHGDHKRISKDICELRLQFGAGYRIYYTELDEVILILLCAGDKKTQSKDIKKAQAYLDELRSRCYDKKQLH